MFTIMIIGLAVFSIIKIILFFYFYQQFERKQKRKVESNNQQRQSQESDAVPSKNSHFKKLGKCTKCTFPSFFDY
ncbi:TPA: hypothetical protein VDG67_000982 [Streptococcus pyogenes]|nr:hypothetical protein [Streptococcus pyogenes]HEP7441344.1 hypothetical protein [Streptococcus pyogenes]